MPFGLRRFPFVGNAQTSAPLCEVGCCDVFITFTVWVPIVEHLAPERVNLAMEQVLPAQHGRCDLGATYSAEY